MVSHGFAWFRVFCVVSLGFAWFGVVSHGFASFCVVSRGFARFRLVSRGLACVVLHMVLNDLCDSHDVCFLQSCVVL